MTFDFSL